MIQDMKTKLTRLLTVVVLIMVSMGAMADVKVLFGEKGDDKVKTDGDKIEATYDGGTIVVTQKVVDATKVTVYLTVTPNKGYTMQEKNVIEAYATAPTNIGKTRAPEVSEKLSLDCEDFKDEYSTRTYYVDIDPALALWVKSVTFEPKKRGNGAKNGTPLYGDNYSGTYYIANADYTANDLKTRNYSDNDKTNNYYLCPSSNYYDGDKTDDLKKMPFLTTHKPDDVGTGRPSILSDPIAKWEIEFAKSDEVTQKDYYYIKFVSSESTKYYLVHNETIVASSYGNTYEGRVRYHLQLSIDGVNEDNCLFSISPGSKAADKNYNISSKAEESRVNSQNGAMSSSINPAKNNMNYYNGQNTSNPGSFKRSGKDANTVYCGGLIGHWDLNDRTGLWYLEDIKLEKPEITYSPETGKVTISSTIEGVDLYYTIDGSTTPTTSSTHYTEPFTITATTTIKAIAMKHWLDDSDVETVTITPQCAKPTITNNDGTITITTLTDDATIYYTTDNSDPTNSPTRQKYTTSFPLGSAASIKAIAHKDGYTDSEVATYGTPTFYIQSNKNKSYFWNLATSEYATGQPYVKTLATQNDNAVWQLIEVAGGYNIMHVYDGKYLVAVANSLDAPVHVESPKPDGNSAIFEVTETSDGSGVYLIKPKGADNADGKNYLSKGSDGTTLSLAASSDENTKWILMSFPLQPVIEVDDISFTIPDSSRPLGTVYYTTDGSDPTESTNTNRKVYSNKVTLEYGPEYTIRAYTIYTDPFGNVYNSAEGETKTIHVAPIAPTLTHSNGMVTITSYQKTGVTYRYTFSDDGSVLEDPVPGEAGPGTDYSTQLPLTASARNEFKAIAYHVASNGTTYKSDVATYIVDLRGETEISSFAGITSAVGNYKFAANFTPTGTPMEGESEIGTSTNPFRGVIDGNFKEITLSAPLFAYVKDATIKNVIVNNGSGSTISGNGAIAEVATGSAHIYNCGVMGGTVSGNGNVGGIVGEIDDYVRVINCYSFATVSGGTNCGGIVGYNKVASTSGNLRTMVMNCMFYGNITGGNPAPVYGGVIIHNKWANDNNTGLNNYNFFLYKDQSYLSSITTYAIARGALGAEERFLNRFEFFRLTLNSTRNMAAFYVCGDATQRDIIAKWVLDKSIAPYPILKKQDYYPSIINPDAESATQINLTDENDRNKGRKFGSLTVKITSVGSGARFSAPAGAHLVDEEGNEVSSRTLTLNITDKDFENYNFNYKKIQLPYYNEVGIGNYTKASATDATGRVVTGWKIVKINDSETGSGTFTGSGSEVTFDDSGNITSTPFNFVDRTCTNKDLYGVSNRVFNQGAYWEVPDEVTSITIEPYWAKCTYLSDANYDVTYDGSTKYGVTVAGSFSKPTALGNQTVYNSVSNAFSNLGSNASHTVYDYAIVLVGNYHQYADGSIINDGSNKPVTFMSADFDGDCEPDNTLFYYQNSRQNVSPIRFDFLNIPGVGSVKRTWNSGMNPQPGIFKPKGWFEITNTVVVRFGQFEYANKVKTIVAPLILQGGIYEQIVSGQSTAAQNTSYLLIGGNAWFKTFANGCHTEKFLDTPKVPINVAGGEYEKFYLSGIYQASGTPTAEGAECYIDGGKFGEVAGSGMQKIDGNVTWLVNGADITSFFGGGINEAQPITGNIRTTISYSKVDEFYGGPKFGDVTSGKIVKTKADDCLFGEFYGAGYGGTAFNRDDPVNDVLNATLNTATWSSYVSSNYKRKYNSGKGGISTDYEYEYILHSDGSRTVARFFVNYASLSLATTRDVTSDLTGCTIGTFFGGGRLGAVAGDVNSTLTNCHVTGNVYGAGFSADVPTVFVWPIENMTPEPKYDRVAGVFNDASVEFPTGVEYTWKHADSVSEGNEFDETGGHYILTTKNLDGLGAVNGDAILNLKGNTSVGGNVFGGGDSSPVNGSTTVNIE